LRNSFTTMPDRTASAGSADIGVRITPIDSACPTCAASATRLSVTARSTCWCRCRIRSRRGSVRCPNYGEPLGMIVTWFADICVWHADDASEADEIDNVGRSRQQTS